MTNKKARKLYRLFFFFFLNKILPVRQAAAGFVSLQHPGAGGEPRGPAMCFHLAAAGNMMDETGLHMLLGEPLGSILPHLSLPAADVRDSERDAESVLLTTRD